MRIAIYETSVVLGIFRYCIQSPWASDCVLLDLFAIPIYFWIGFEIVYAAKHVPFRVLEWAGSWSNSLYLVHSLVIPVLSVIELAFIAVK
jgi:peptidoglycan/LPS O-acetylase OafA/YrhL